MFTGLVVSISWGREQSGSSSALQGLNCQPRPVGKSGKGLAGMIHLEVSVSR